MGRISLLVLDAILINFSFIFAYFFRFKIFDLGAAGLGTLLSRYSNVLIFVTFVWLAIFNLFNLYEQKRSTSEIDEAASVLAATTVGTILLLAITILHRELLFSSRVIVYAWLFSTLLVGLSRIVILEVRRLLRRFGLIANRTLILGAGERGQMIAHKLLRHPEMGYKLIGFLDDDPTKINQSFHKIKVLGNLSEVKNAVRTEKIDNVLVAIPEIPTFKLMEVISACETEKVEVKLIPNILEIMASRISTDEVG